MLECRGILSYTFSELGSALTRFTIVRYNETKLLQLYIGGTFMKSAKRYLIIVGIGLPVVIVGGLIVSAIFHVLLAVLYVFLIILAVLLIAAMLFQIYSILMLVRTITTVRNEMKPLLASVQETVGIVKDTVQTAGHTAATIGSTARLTSQIAVAPGVRVVAGCSGRATDAARVLRERACCAACRAAP